MDTIQSRGRQSIPDVAGIIYDAVINRLAPLKIALWLTLAALLRIPLLFDGPWYDEAFTMWLADLPLEQMLAATAGDVHPPLWYLISWLTGAVFGVSALTMRLPAFIFGLLALWLSYRVFTVAQVPRPVTMVALGLLTINPFAIYYSAEGRMYSVLLVLVLWAVLSVQTERWWQLGAAIGLGLLTHNLMALYIPALLVIVRPGWGLIRSGLLAGLIWVPWGPVLVNQVEAVNNGFWVLPITPGRAVYLLYHLLAGPPKEPYFMPIALIVFALLAVGWWPRRLSMWSVLAFGPLLLGWAISVAYTPILIPRVLIGSVPFLAMLLAYGVVTIHNRFGVWSIVPGLIAVGLVLASTYLVDFRPDYAARYNQVPVASGDNCYHLTPASMILSKPYLDCNHYLWPQANTLEQTLTDTTKQAMGMQQAEFADIPPGKTWLFHNAGPFSTPEEFTQVKTIVGDAPPVILDDTGVIVAQVWEVQR